MKQFEKLLYESEQELEPAEFVKAWEEGASAATQLANDDMEALAKWCDERVRAAQTKRSQYDSGMENAYKSVADTIRDGRWRK